MEIEFFRGKSVNHDMSKAILVLLGAVALVCSCVPSVNPYYTAKDVITDPRLPGEWRDTDNKDKTSSWKFEDDGTNGYKLTITEDKGKTGVFNAHLFQLGQEDFLDLIPGDCNFAPDQAGLVGVAMIPGHLLMHVSILEPTLHLALCDPDWLKKYLAGNPDAIAHSQYQDMIYFTASTRDLQKFVLKHLGKGELFSDGGDLVRVTNSVPVVPK